MPTLPPAAPETAVRRLGGSWAPILSIGACLAVAGASAWLGHRHISGQADAQLAAAGELVARQLETELRARLRALENLAAFDAAQSDPSRQALARQAVIDGLTRLYPELVWVGFALQPGRVVIAQAGVLTGADVSARAWWTGALRGPYLGGIHDAVLLSASLPPERATQPGAEPIRLLEPAVPLRDAHGKAYGVPGAHLDGAWLSGVRDELERVEGSLADAQIVLVERGGRVVSGQQAMALDSNPVEELSGRSVAGTLDGAARVFGGHPIDGDVAVSRLGWSVFVARDPEVHYRLADRFVAQAMAVGALAAAGLAATLAWLLRRRPAP